MTPDSKPRLFSTLYPRLTPIPSWKHIFRKALTRPFAIFAHEPIIQVLGVYMAFVYGVFYRTPSFKYFNLTS